LVVQAFVDACHVIQIGNCVGAANHRSFILFLFFTVISTFYVCAMSMVTICKIWSDRMKSGELQLDGWAMTRMEVLLSYLVVWIGSSLTSSVRAIGLIYLVVLSLSVMIGVGLLLHQQVRHIYEGKTFIESLQHHNGVVKGIKAPTPGWRNLRRLFGHGHPVFWVLPRFVVSQDIKVQ
jgi:palmitoyltransferase